MWFTIADLLQQKLCFERSKTGSCSHTAKRGKYKGQNPCDVTQRMIDAISNGFQFASPTTVIEHLQSKRCNNTGCNHRGCADIDNAIRSIDINKAA